MTSRLPLASLIAGAWLALASPALAAPSLPGGIIRDLEALEQRLRAQEHTVVRDRALAQAERLAGGNAADRWARALYLQLAASAEARAGRAEAAADLLREARASDVADAEQRDRWQRQEAGLRLAAGDMAAGVALLDDWFQRHAGLPSDHWRMARAQAELERWDAAARWVKRALEAGDTPDEAQRALAVAVYRRAGHDERALALLGDGLDADSDAEAWRGAAGLAQRLGAPGQAAALWEAGWRLGVLSDSEDRLTLVKLHLAGGTPARAAEHLAEALDEEVLPDTLEHRRLLAQAWAQARDRERALSAWRHVARRSDAGDDWLRLGQLAHGWGREALAERALEAALERGVEVAEAWLAVLQQEGRGHPTRESAQDVTQVP
ncbi:hypothetical protein [Halomonas cerina]|uniref:Tetratricopeptide repeat protein n=1 Tax=Halomonas cerina TaxID=447424 RepID=A0A839VAT0_9GAMM|nr:hypothetical protein [Halomonas cerina]MBB3191085.1 hypothetical protein [Halomonas cerina]